MKRFLLVALCVAGCTKKNDHVTPSGTQVLAWDLAQAEHEWIRGATTSDIKVQDVDYGATLTDGGAVKLKVHLETATVVFEAGGKQVTHASPIKLAVQVVDAADYTLGGAKCMGPDTKLTAPDVAAPRDMILFCIVKATKPNTEASFMIYTYGDGRIDDGNPKTQKVM